MNHTIEEALDQGFYTATAGDAEVFDEYEHACRQVGAPVVYVNDCSHATVIAGYDHLPLAEALAEEWAQTGEPGPHLAFLLEAFDDCAYLYREKYPEIEGRLAVEPAGRLFLIGHPPETAPALALALSLRLVRLNRRVAYRALCGESG